jgi:hypothetical protein
MSKMEQSVINDTSPKTWVVLGNKRGGTTFITQLLGDNGVEIDHCNNGHNEDLDFVRFNESILKEAGGNWNILPSREKIAEAIENNSDRLAALIEKKKAGKEAWGWKDPRQGATIQEFLPYLDDDVYLVCVFRKPLKVGESINRIWPRHSVDFGKRIAQDYYGRILDAAREFIDES